MRTPEQLQARIDKQLALAARVRERRRLARIRRWAKKAAEKQAKEAARAAKATAASTYKGWRIDRDPYNSSQWRARSGNRGAFARSRPELRRIIDTLESA